MKIYPPENGIYIAEMKVNGKVIMTSADNITDAMNFIFAMALARRVSK